LGLTSSVDVQELPQNLYGSPRASALAAVDRHYNGNALIVADLSNDPTYAEPLLENFGPRVIGLQIGRYGDCMTFERRPSNTPRCWSTPLEQLAGLETELRESGTVYTCPPGQHDDLGISCAMLAWAARHPHLPYWIRDANAARRPRRPRPSIGNGGWT
jgi:hypothetical protein